MTPLPTSKFDVRAAHLCNKVVDRFSLENVSVLAWEFRTHISTDHKMYYTGPESGMHSTALNRCMADCYGSHLVVIGPIW